MKKLLFEKALRLLMFVIILWLITPYFLIFIGSVSSYTPSVIVGKSMEPTFRDGSLLFSQEVQPSDIRIGDIIVFPLLKSDRSINYFVIHRVIGIQKKSKLYFETKGDNNANLDLSLVRESLVSGRIVFYIPHGKYIFWPSLFFKYTD